MSNLLSIMSAATGRGIDELVPEYEDKMYGHLKKDVAEAVVAMLEPIQQRYHDMRNDREFLNQVMKKGADKAREAAHQTLSDVYKALALYNIPVSEVTTRDRVNRQLRFIHLQLSPLL